MKSRRSIFNHLSVNIKIKFVVLSVFVSVHAYGQQHKDLGVGTFTLQWFYYPNSVFSTDSTSNILLKRLYHIKHSRVIMKTIGPPEKVQKDTVERISRDNELTLKSKMSAKAVYPTYLADYNKQEYYMYFDDTKRLFYYRDSLKNHPEDLYNSKVSNNDKTTIVNIKDKEINIAGKHCLTALAISGTDTTKFYYTEEKLNFISPLKIHGVSNPILGIQTLQKDGKAFGLFITYIKEEELPNDEFTIPATARLKTWSEIMTLSKIPN